MRKIFYTLSLLLLTNAVYSQTELAPDVKIELKNTGNKFSGHTLDVINLEIATTGDVIKPKTGVGINFITKYAGNDRIINGSIVFQRDLRVGSTADWQADGHIRFFVHKIDRGTHIQSFEEVASINADGISLNEGKTLTIINDSIQWPDYVFNKSYKLKTLEELEVFINENKHLPDVPSKEEVQKEGVDILEMNKVLLKKIEELTLYMIEQNKKLNEQQKMIDLLQKRY